MTPDELEILLQAELHDRETAHRLRRRQIVRPIDATRVEVDGRTLVNFSSNNYLGLSFHPAIGQAIERVQRTHGFGSGAAALISGYSDVHADAEAAIAAWKGTDASVLLPSGYQANAAAIQTLASVAERHPTGVLFLVDKLAHASLIDAIRATGQPFRVFPHNNLSKLRRLLEGSADAGAIRVVVTESIFSMDGDAADLRGLAALKADQAFILLLDEAHGSGVYGPDGRGYAAEAGLQSIVDISIVTFSKALGGIGGAVCGSRAFCETLVNVGRSYIYSTHVPAACAAAAMAAVELLRAEPERQRRVRELSRRVREQLAALGFSLPSGDSPIIPIVLGAEEAALRAATTLRQRGLLALAVRPPTVPPGSSRLRLTLSCEHTDEQVDRLVGVLRELNGR